MTSSLFCHRSIFSPRMSRCMRATVPVFHGDHSRVVGTFASNVPGGTSALAALSLIQSGSFSSLCKMFLVYLVYVSCFLVYFPNSPGQTRWARQPICVGPTGRLITTGLHFLAVPGRLAVLVNKEQFSFCLLQPLQLNVLACCACLGFTESTRVSSSTNNEPPGVLYHFRTDAVVNLFYRLFPSFHVALKHQHNQKWVMPANLEGIQVFTLLSKSSHLSS